MSNTADNKKPRKAMTTVETVLILGALALVVIGTIAVLGQRVNSDLGTTASDVANPAQLVNRFGGP